MSLTTDSKTSVELLLSQLTLEEKVSLLSGHRFNATPGVPRLGIPPIQVADSINGIRPSDPSSDETTACFPSTTCLASTWDVELLGRLGEQLARQAKLKGAQVVLGPTINIHRDPRGGRNFECFSEDPLLSGQLAGAIVNGIQKHGVGACPKHFVCNDSETLRHFYDVAESPHGRTLREIYLAAWQHLLRVSDPVAIMLAYNKVDGFFCSENKTLVTGILRETWGYQGATISDWFAVHSTVEPIRAGLDLEMPFPINRGRKLLEAVREGLVTEEELDARVANLLRLRDRIKSSHQDAAEQPELSEEVSNLAYELASSGIVLLKNDHNILSLDPFQTSTIAVIGEFATNPPVTGGGSASCKPQYTQNPLALLQSAFTTANPDSQVYHAPGVRTNAIIPVVPTSLLTSSSGNPGVTVSYYNPNSTTPIHTTTLSTPHISMLGPPYDPPTLSPLGSHLTLTTTLTPPTTGTHTLAVRHTGSFTLCIDSTPVLSAPEPAITTSDYLFHPALYESRIQLPMKSGTPYAIHLTMSARAELMSHGEPTPYGLTLCFEEGYDTDTAISSAVEAASKSDITVIFAGRSEQHESEGFDMEGIQLPGHQARMIKEVSKVSKKTVVVLYCGNPVEVESWIDDVDGVICAHFPGQEGGRAVADVLMGAVNPSGKLATTWWKGLERSGSFGWFPAKQGEVMKYGEGVAVGYRKGMEGVRWGFGFGLAYTEFWYGELRVEVDEGKGVLRCAVRVENKGQREGSEVVQVYVVPVQEGVEVWRPERELKGFTKVLLGAGESRRVELEINLKVACSYWDEGERCWRMEMGTYWVQVGDLTGSFVVAGAAKWNHL
ncbi:thermostable beta-glucosidase B [Cercophora newfieldiana]|uniref:beta-glucosidase n=1 Tax=Cercophora newfieldiana TaxID=92897 RepID=A0AA39YLQ1_9PEZI|nr:thermostable beta-glucosidase B [Cercophora newfieldiana]